jgi:predicted nucleotidyltransferase
MDDTTNILSQISRAVHRVEPTAEVILFGSRARGSARPDSDWDVLVLLKGEVTANREQAIFSSLSAVELTYGEIFSTLIYEKTYWQQILKGSPLYQNVNQEGLLLA